MRHMDLIAREIRPSLLETLRVKVVSLNCIGDFGGEPAEVELSVLVERAAGVSREAYWHSWAPTTTTSNVSEGEPSHSDKSDGGVALPRFQVQIRILSLVAMLIVCLEVRIYCTGRE